MIRTNVFPVLVLTAGVFVWCAIEFVGKFFPILAMLSKAVYFVGGACSGKKRRKAVMRPGKPIRSRCATPPAAIASNLQRAWWLLFLGGGVGISGEV